MPRGETGTTRDRILTEAMRLFGEQGYEATSVTQIEEAVGLSPGAGGLYRHFRSKRELLAEGVRRQIEEGEELITFLSDPQTLSALPLRDRFAAVTRAGLERLERERDLNRLLVRDLARFPDLLDQVRAAEIGRVHRGAARWLEQQAAQGQESRDWDALAAVLVGAASHYWLLRDIFGRPPYGIEEARYVAAIAELAAGLFEQGTDGPV